MKTGVLLWVSGVLATITCRAETVTFVVGSAPDWPNGTNAFIVTVTDPQDISYARVLVATGGL
jgi:hypothetical protein